MSKARLLGFACCLLAGMAVWLTQPRTAPGVFVPFVADVTAATQPVEAAKPETAPVPQAAASTAEQVRDSSATKPAVQTLSNHVTVLRVAGTINPATADFITEGLDQARDQGAGLVIIELDTPGGLDTSMRSIVRGILASPVPVAGFVSPAGARAASAGAFILYASHVAAMTPASNLGAASPVSIGTPSATGGQDTEKEKDTGKKSDGDTMTRKVTNDAAAYIRSLAQLRGRNADFAEKAVVEATSLSSVEALKDGVIDLVATNVPDLLSKLDGRQIKMDDGTMVKLNTANPEINYIEPDLRTQFLTLIANPQVAVMLMMVGIYGLFFELLSPGGMLPGVAGLISLLLAMYAFQLMPVSWSGVGLIAAGTTMMIAEVFLPSFGALGIGGIIAFVLGGLMLTDTGIQAYDLSLPFIVGVAVSSAALIFIAGGFALRSRQREVVTGKEQMVGSEGVVTFLSNGKQYADVRGESWQVRGDRPLAVGERVRVEALNGLVLQVVSLDRVVAPAQSVGGA
ncbi:NfeD family protein [Allopusillimonas ginsengisoli]|uniref:NfeD family protein n=1 Tax=Allopusillimonas ginsengisoli TaxID=453575 RepID=UPI0039C2DEE6